jgi:gliding motility-associated-like protein
MGIDTNTVSYLNYIQNKGQFHENVLFQAGFRGGTVYLEKNAFTWVFYPAGGVDTFHHHAPAAATPIFHTVRMSFENAAPETEMLASGKQAHYLNYFKGKDPAKWAKKVPVYNAVQYKNKYEGISVKAFGDGNDMRYDLIVAPGADISQVQLKFEGQNSLSIRDGQLIIGTSVGGILQKAPVAYQVVRGKIKEVGCEYILDKNKLSFKITGYYDKKLPLIIDPTLVFATFSGSTADNWGMTATYDGDGNAYTAGITFDAGYPTTTGSFQANFAGGVTDAIYPFGGFDISISKFNAAGNNLLYATYLGGTHNELPVSIVADNASNLYVLGKTYSSDYPVTAGAYDVTFNGGVDIVVSKLSSDGSALPNSTFVGGSLDDGVNIDAYEPTLASLKYNYADDGRGGILLDNANNVYVGTCTMSTDFPVTAGCIQPSNAGMQDACIFKMPPDLGSMSFSTYLGGAQNDAAYNIALDSKDRLYVTGGTESSDFPVTATALHTTYAGQIDGFVSHLNLAGTAILHSTYVGTTEYDQSYFVQTDKFDGVYLYGQTNGVYPVTPGVYSNPNSGQFIHKLDSNLSVTLFSTVFGTGSLTPSIVPSAFLVDHCGNIYVSGWGGTLGGYNPAVSSMAGMPVTADAFQPATDDNDFYFLVLDKNAIALKYATFFGGSTIAEHVDGGTSRFDKSGVIYQAICGGCGGQSGMPTTPGVWSNTNNGPNCNNALVKFSFDMEITIAHLATNLLSTSGCAPLTVAFLNSSINSVQYEWVFGDGAVSTLEEPTHTYTIPGTYQVMLIAIDSSTCNIRDTVYAEIIVHPGITIAPMPDITLCELDTFYLSASAPGATSYSWSPATGLNDTAVFNPFGQAIASQTYSVTVSNGFCEATTSVHVQVNPEIIAQANTDVVNNSGCAPLTVNFLNTSLNSTSYQWFFGDGGNAVIAEPTHTYTSAGTYQAMLIASSSSACNISDTAFMEIIVAPPLSITTTPVVQICEHDTFQLSAVVPGALTYSWSPATGLNDPSVSNPLGVASSSQSYTVIASNGVCEAIDSVQVFVIDVLEAELNTGLPADAGCAPLTVNFTNPGSTAAYYQWDFGDGTGSTQEEPSHLYTSAGTYNVVFIAIDSSTCNIRDTAYTVITVTPPVSIDPMPQIELCKYETFQLNAATSGALTLNWVPAAGLSDPAISNPTGTALSSQTYILTAGNSVCQVSESVTVLVNENSVTIGIDMLQFCTATSAEIYTDTIYAGYLWNNGQTSPEITVTQTGLYYVETTDFNGCRARDSIEVSFLSFADLIGSDTLVCPGRSVQLQTVEGYTYDWSPASSLNDAHIFNPLASPDLTTQYTVSVAVGPCLLTDTILVTLAPSMYVEASPNEITVLPGEPIDMVASSDTIVYWSPSRDLSCSFCNYTIATPDTDMIYYATAYDQFGCSYSDSVRVNVSPTLYIPNAFTPGGTGTLNSIFRPEFVGYRSIEVLIFNRWGEEIYKWNTLDGGWDGTYQGKKVQQDVYIYKLRAIDYQENEIEKNGTVTVVR